MSYRRIASVFTRFRGDKRLGGPDIAALLGLAWCENPTTHACFPSKTALQELTHFGGTAVAKSCKHLKELGVIDWKHRRLNGGSSVNDYVFLFPDGVPAKTEPAYSTTVTDESVPNPGPVDMQEDHLCITPELCTTPELSADHPSRDDGSPIARRRVTHRETMGHPSRDDGSPIATRSQSVQDQKKISVSNRERERDRERVDGRVDFESICKDAFEGYFAGSPVQPVSAPAQPVSASAPEPPAPDYVSPVRVKRILTADLAKMAMAACRVKDDSNRFTFVRVIGLRDRKICEDVIRQFASEVRQGEHNGAHNLAAVLTQRLKTVPNDPSVM